MNKYFALFVVLLAIVATSTGHIRLREPPNRSSIWRDPRFTHLNPRENTRDDGIYCSGQLQLPSVENCGVCGDPLSESVPRSNEHGGVYGQGIIVGEYHPGQEIPINVEVTIPHKGSFHIRLCDQIPETDACFFKLQPLLITTQEFGTVTEIPIDPNEPKWINGTVKLPGVLCRHCVLRLNYRGGSNLGDCEDGTVDYGCGLQQNFRSCADISISP